MKRVWSLSLNFTYIKVILKLCIENTRSIGIEDEQQRNKQSFLLHGSVMGSEWSTKNRFVSDQNISCKNMPLQHSDYFEP